jgi:hypothetical protein
MVMSLDGFTAGPEQSAENVGAPGATHVRYRFAG